MMPINFHLDDDKIEKMVKYIEDHGCTKKWFFNKATEVFLESEGYMDD